MKPLKSKKPLQINIKRTAILGVLIGVSFAQAAQARKMSPAALATLNASPVVASAQGANKIGLVLSGGGARGLAHLGVLKALEEQRVPVDLIAGTSAGAIVGGMYASGMSIDEIERKITALDLDEVAFASADRREVPQQTRDLDYKANSFVDISVTESGKVTLPAAISNGNKVEAVLRDLVQQYPYDIDFNALPTPFSAVAGDLQTGGMVVLKKGQLAQALRASMSIPAVFSPVSMDGKVLVDGMIARNLPVDVARNMGATRIIAVDVGSDLLSTDKLNSVLGVSEQLLNFLVKRNVDEQKATLTARDVLIRPALGDFASLNFKNGAQAVKIGWETMQTAAMRQMLSSFAVSPEAYQAFKQQRHVRATPLVKIDFIRVQTNGLASPASLRGEIKMSEGQLFDLKVVNADIARLVSSGRIGSVKYEINKVGDQNELVYVIGERDIAKNAIRAGVEVNSNGLSDQQFAIHLSHRRLFLNRFGGEWRNDAVLGKTSSIETQLHQPLSYNSKVFIRPYAKFEYAKRPVYFNNSDNIGAEYATQRQTYGLVVGAPIGRIGEWGVGLSYRRARLFANSDNPLLPISDAQTARTTLDAQITFDQLDDIFVPTKGYFARAYAHVSPFKTNAERFVQMGVMGVYAHKMKAHSLALMLEAAGQNNHDNVYLSPFALGGYQHLSGYAQNRFVGNYMAFGSLTYRYSSPWQVLGSPLVLGASVEAGNTWERAADISGSGMKYSGSVFGALRTPIGPAQLGVGFNKQGNARVYFFLGKTFSETP